MLGKELGSNLIEINHQPMIKYVIDAIKPQVKDILINANRNAEEYKQPHAFPELWKAREDF